jgi:ubiquinone/menaquinone biosynthesis C-methylase UbiE
MTAVLTKTLPKDAEVKALETGDAYKDEVQRQWDRDACGSQYVEEAQPDTLAWYLEVERYRYGKYAPWKHDLYEFDKHAGKKVLEVGGGLGTDLSQFAKNGALTTDYDLSSGHLAHAKRNFQLRGLKGEFVHGDGERMPFDDNTFDVVFSNGVIHHTPNTDHVIGEIFRVLKPGGKAIIMVYAEHSLHYYKVLVGLLGLDQGQLERNSIGWIMSGSVEMTSHDSRPLVKVYTEKRLRQMFSAFERISVHKRQLVDEEVPQALKWIPLDLLGRMMGWNLIIKAHKPVR